MDNPFFLVVFFLGILFLPNVFALNLDIHVPEEYVDVVAGERLYFEVVIKYPENPSRKDLSLDYEVLTEDGHLVSQAKTLRAVETQASFVDFIVIPAVTHAGLYFIRVEISELDGNFIGETSGSFNVNAGDNNEVMIYLMMILVSVLVVGVLVVVDIFSNKRSAGIKVDSKDR